MLRQQPHLDGDDHVTDTQVAVGGTGSIGDLDDLDAETLDLLEERVAEFSGTVLLVSHDRDFLDNVVTSTLAFDGDGVVKEYAGGYQEWFAQRPSARETQAPKQKKERARPGVEAPPKLSFKENRELEALHARLEALEAKQAELFARTADPVLYKGGKGDIATAGGKDVAGIPAALELAARAAAALVADAP